jgi:hypothetical protein
MGTSTTVEEPLTPAMRGLLLGRAQLTRWASYTMGAICAVGGGWITVGLFTSAYGDVAMEAIAGFIGLVAALLTAFSWWIGHRVWQRAQLDVREGVCLKTTGPVSVKEEDIDAPQGGSYTRYELRVGGRVLPVNGDVAFALEDQRQAIVLYSKHSGVVFEARDLTGNLLYRHSRL